MLVSIALALSQATSQAIATETARALQAPVFSRESKKIFALGMEGGRWYAVGRVKKSFGALSDGYLQLGNLQVAKGGKALAFAALAEEQISGAIYQNYRMIVNDEIMPSPHVRTGLGSLSADGKHVAQKYLSFSMTMGISIDEGNGKEPGFDYVGRPTWDPKAKRVAFASVTDAGGVDHEALTHKGELQPREGEWRLIQWTRKGEAVTSARAWERLRTPSFSASGEAVVARVLDKEGWRVAVFDLDIGQ